MEYFIGIVVSLAVQYMKSRGKTDVAGTYLIVCLVSFVGAGLYVLVEDTSIWPVFMQVLTVSGAFYAFVIRRFEEA